MLHAIVLIVATLAIAGLTLALWWRTRQLAFVIGSVMLYYWSLYISWFMIWSGLGYGRGYQFQHLYHDLFPVYLDDNYLSVIILYSLFLLTVQFVVLLIAKPPPSQPIHVTPVRISHGVLLATATGLLAMAYLVVSRLLRVAIATGSSSYELLAGQQLEVPFFTLYQICHQSALNLALTGFVVMMAGAKARFIAGRTSLAVALCYLPVMGGAFLLNILMGDRSMLFFAAISAGLFYMANTWRPSKALLVGGAAAVIMAVPLLGVIRGSAGVRDLSNQDLLGKVRYLYTVLTTSQTESFAAHASMYGALEKHVPLTYGTSFVWLATSVIPQVLRPATSETIYFHYARHVGAKQGRGFNIHHATGWYLNFGILGLLAGAVCLGALWATLFNRFNTPESARSLFGRVFSTVAFWNLTGFFPVIIRNGPEGYKSIVIESLLIPAVLMTVACMRVLSVDNRLRIVAPRVPLPTRTAHEDFESGRITQS